MLLKDYIKFAKKIQRIFFLASLLIVLRLKKIIFFAIKGNQVDGNRFINKAIHNGAKIIISEKKGGIKKGYYFLKSNNTRKLLSEISYKILNRKPKKLVAVTGTNGKSSIQIFIFKY